MAWFPASALGYPFTLDNTVPDVNKDGEVNELDAFDPYWPGDDLVDWVGIRAYWWGWTDEFVKGG